jgi:hypothetical protein
MRTSTGRGAKPPEVTERVIRTAGGPRVTIEFKRGLDGSAILTALRSAVAIVEAGPEGDQAAA